MIKQFYLTHSRDPNKNYQSGPGSNEGVLHIPHNSKSGVSPSNDLVSYPGHLMAESYPSAEM